MSDDPEWQDARRGIERGNFSRLALLFAEGSSAEDGC